MIKLIVDQHLLIICPMNLVPYKSDFANSDPIPRTTIGLIQPHETEFEDFVKILINDIIHETLSDQDESISN